MLSNWTYYYKLPPSGTLIPFTSIRTENGDLLFEDAKERDAIFLRRSCNTEFTLTGADYGTFKALFDTDPCDEVTIHLYEGGVERWSGKINLKKIKWFPDICNAKFTSSLQDEYTCIKENWEDEKNIFGFGSSAEVETFFGTLTELTCGPVNSPTANQINGYFELNVNACLSGNDAAYTLKRAYIEEITPGSSYDHYATFVTEQATTTCTGGVGGTPNPPPGNGWILLQNDCATLGTCDYGRPVQVSYVGEESATSGKYWDNTYEVVSGTISNYDNGRFFESIIQGLLNPCSYTVVSNFFDINADATAPSNTAYTASSALHNLMIFQKSDIKRPNATNPATIGYVTLKKMLDWLGEMFNVYWIVDGTDFRLEHISYFDGPNGDDLTVLQSDIVNKRNGFTFDTDKLAPREAFSWMDPTTDADFKGLDIVYPSACSDPEQEKNTFNLDQVFTDLGKVQASVDMVSDEGFFFMATDLDSGTYYINREAGEISGELKPNAHLSWANLQENYLTWGRLQPTGTLNNVSRTFNSYKRSKRQQSLPVVY